MSREGGGQADKLIHPILKRSHSNAREASHKVLTRFRAKDISMETMHYYMSTNLGLHYANLIKSLILVTTGYPSCFVA